MEETSLGFEFHIVAMEFANYMVSEKVGWRQAVEDKGIPKDLRAYKPLLEAQTKWYLKNATPCE